MASISPIFNAPQGSGPEPNSPLRATIVHISDLHVGRCFDPHLGDAIIEEARRCAPDIIVVSGDLVNNPFPRSFRAALRYLRRLQVECNNAEVVLVPGNHDLKLFGSIWWWGARSNFEVFFGEFGVRNWGDGGCPLQHATAWKRKLRLLREAAWGFFQRLAALPDRAKATVRAAPLAEGNVLVVNYDSNAVAWNARGKIRPGELTGTEAAIRVHEGKLDPLALRVAVVHHHPLPIPYADKSSLTNKEHFLVFKNAGTFLREMAARDFDLVLHGHKHYSHFSRINYQVRADTRTEIGVLAAGSATIRGGNANQINSLNLIRFFANGRTEVELREFGENKSFHRPAHAPEPFELHTEAGLLERTFRRNRQVHPVWAAKHELTVKISKEGDATTWCKIEGLRNENQPLKGYKISFHSRVGFYSRQSLSGDPGGMALQKGRTGNERKPAENFADYLKRMRLLVDRLEFGAARGSLDRALDFGFEWDLVSGFAMSESEYHLLYPPTTAAQTPQEAVGEFIVIPVERLRLGVRLPRGFNAKLRASARPLEDFDAHNVIVDGWIDRPETRDIGRPDPFLSEIASRALRTEVDGEEEIWTLDLKHPPVGFCYMLTWDLPRLTPTALYLTMRGPAMAERAALVQAANDVSRTDAVRQRLARMLQVLHEEYQSGYPDETMDLTLFTFHATERTMIAVGTARTPEENDPAKPDELRSFRPPAGVGTAGQCFKTGRAVVYERLDQNVPFSSFLPFGPNHEVLVSVPVYLGALYRRDVDAGSLSSMERNNVMVAVLTVGSTSPGSNLRKLDPDELGSAGQALVREILSDMVR